MEADDIIAITAEDLVKTISAVKGVICGINAVNQEEVVSCPALKVIHTGPAGDDVVAVTSGQQVVARSALKYVVARPAGNGVVAGSTD